MDAQIPRGVVPVAGGLEDLLSTVRGTRLFDLSHPMAAGMPAWSEPFHHLFRQRHGDAVRPSGASVGSDVAFWPMHNGTHMDALSHYSSHGKLYGDHDAAAAQRGTVGMQVHGAESLPLYAGRAVVLDARSVPDRPLSPADLEAFQERQGVSVGRGEALFVATGWESVWSDPARYCSRAEFIPGLSPEAADWAAERGVAILGTDTATVESSPNQGELHRRAIALHGLYLVENLVLSGLLAAGAGVCLALLFPVAVRGGTAAPVRAVALLPAA